MVINILIIIITKILNFFVWILPGWKIKQEFLDGFLSSVESAFSLSIFFPIGTILIILTVIISFEITMLIVKASSGLLSLIRGGGRLDI